MNVTMKCSTNLNKPGIVYAKLDSDEGILVSATFDYCIGACDERGYVITNAQDVLLWLHRNADVVAYKRPYLYEAF